MGYEFEMVIWIVCKHSLNRFWIAIFNGAIQLGMRTTYFIGNYQQALQCYKQIHKRFPENLDCLRFMVRLCNDLGLKEAQDYSLILRKAEKSMEAKRQRELSSGSGKSSGGSSGSRGHGSVTSSTTNRTRLQVSAGGNYCN